MHFVVSHVPAALRAAALHIGLRASDRTGTVREDTHAEEGHMFENWSLNFYPMLIAPLLAVTLILAWLARPSTTEVVPLGFRRFQLTYLSAWGLCVAADWLQGPYVYAIYAEYGFSKQDIAALFVMGFASSMVFGSVVGIITDRYGRKRCALLYCGLYVVSCATKHFKNYQILMVGRFTGGLATSLLFSCFECWMVSEHVGRKKFSTGLLSYMFGLMYSTMYLVAIVSGFVAGVVAEGFKLHPLWEGSIVHVGGDTGPFDLAAICLIAGAVLISLTWEENFGEDNAEQNDKMLARLEDAFSLFRRDARIPLLGAIVACFEGAMYVFIFNWSPALKSAVIPPPYGLIFSLFMMACMSGTSVHTAMAEIMRPTFRLFTVFLLGMASLVTVSVLLGETSSAEDPAHGQHLMAIFLAFLLFEFAIGVYFPSVGILKSEVVPERIRSTVYNVYRVPLNAVVVGLLLSDVPLVHCYALCACLLGVAFGAAAGLVVLDRRGSLAALGEGRGARKLP
mmetsp:Transcript_115250/g.304350  ORF Transcript_115250/g.304350 Transcript_115250/m.304350 type:complete len:509 (-) Transcript_115250:3-1529(-)